MSRLFTSVAVFFSLIASAQTSLNLELKTGFGKTSDLGLYQGNSAGPICSVNQIGVNTKITISPKKNIQLIAGLALKHIYTQSEIGASSFTMHTWRTVVPIRVEFNAYRKLRIQLGAAIQNNRNYNDIFVGQPFNFRYDLMAGLIYPIATKIDLSIGYQKGISPTGKAYYLYDPSNFFHVGCLFHFHIHKTK